MLVMTVKPNEPVYAYLADGREITFRIVRRDPAKRGGGVRIGITAPADVKILRSGLVRREDKEADQ